MAVLDWNNVVGDKTLANGGYAGDLLELGGLHIQEGLDKGRITQGEAGLAYVQLIQSSFEQSIAFELMRDLRIKEVELKEAEINLTLEQIESENLKQERAQIDINTAQFELDEIKPLEKNSLEEQIETENLKQEEVNVQIDTAKFDLNEIKPVEKNSLEEQIESENLKQEGISLENVGRQIDVEEIKPLEVNLAQEKVNTESIQQDGIIVKTDLSRYDLTYLKPEELNAMRSKLTTESMQQALINEQTQLSDKQGIKVGVETDLLNYELGTINPKKVQIMDEELDTAVYNKKLIEQKEIAEEIKNGLDHLGGTINTADSTYVAQRNVIDEQAKLVARQTKGFEEEKDLRILKTQVDYATMTYDSQEDPDFLEIGKDLYITRLYNKMINPEGQPLDTPDTPHDNRAETPQRIGTCKVDLSDPATNCADGNTAGPNPGNPNDKTGT